MSSATSAGIAVITPWPISAAGETMVTTLSVPIVTQALGWNGLPAFMAWASAVLVVPPKATAAEKPPAVTMKLRRLSGMALMRVFMAQAPFAARSIARTILL